MSDSLKKTGLRPDCLKLEINELDLAANADVLAETFAILFALGVKIHIDDVGSSSSSLLQLERFPVDSLKLDRSIVAGLGIDPKASVVARAVVGLGHGLGFKVIAKGVEHEVQFRELCAMGCEYAQGHYFSPPVSSEDIHRLVLGTVRLLDTDTPNARIDARSHRLLLGPQPNTVADLLDAIEL